MVPCDACGMAVDATDNANGVKHPSCRGRFPRRAKMVSIMLGSLTIQSHAWKTHLVEVCYNNLRRNGPDIDPELLTVQLKKKEAAKKKSAAAAAAEKSESPVPAATVSLTKVKKKTREVKEALVKEIRHSVDKYKHLFVFTIEDMRSTH
ncbi:hypothetical protein OSTOST_20056, partial [Ostertagia ostertagi]